MLPLTKIMDMPGDLENFSPYVRELLQPHRYPSLLDGQHEARRWEYGMALEAIQRWEPHQQDVGGPWEILDAGGATSNLWQALTSFTSEDIRRVDPLLSSIAAELGQYINIPETLTGYAEKNPARHGRIDVITCISVIEHIPEAELPAFFQAARTLLKPGGLFVLTTDYRQEEGPDTAHFHWMRERIYTPETVWPLIRVVKSSGFDGFGDLDLSWHGPQLYDYAMAAMAFTKQEE